MRLTVRNIIRLFTFFLLAFAGFSASAQYNTEIYQRIKDTYKGEKLVQLHKDVTYEIHLVKGLPQVFIRSNESYIYLKDASVMGVKRSVYSSQSYELTGYEANMYILQGAKYKKTAIKEKKEISNNQNYAFYDDMHEYSIEFNGVKEGTIIELNTVHQITEPRLMRSFFFSEYIPLDEVSVKFIVDNNIDLNIIPVHLDKVQLNYAEIAEKSSKLYQWTGKHIDALEFEDNTPSEKYYVAHVIPIIKSYTINGKPINVLSSVKDLYHWYYSFIKEATTDVNDGDLHKLADSLTVNCKTEIEKVQAIYYWVQSNIKYIAFEYGMGGFIPRKPDDIYHKRYGDCKDKSCILYSLLKLAGVTSYFTWIGTNDIPYTYREVPAPSTDNHMIVTYKNDTAFYFLDGTSSNLPLGIPSSFIQGKDALIAIDLDNFEIRKVPVLPSEDNLVYDSIFIQIEDQQIAGSGDITVTGYPYYLFHNRYTSRDNSDQKETVKDYLEKGNNKFMLSDYKMQNMHDFDISGNLTYDFTVGDYIKKIDNEIYLNLNMDRTISDYRIDDDRKYPIQFDYNAEYRFKAVLEIPKNYEVGYIPENAEFDSPDYGYKITYELKDNQLIYEHSHYRNTLLIGEDNLKDWKDYIKNIENAYKETVLLRQIKN